MERLNDRIENLEETRDMLDWFAKAMWVLRTEFDYDLRDLGSLLSKKQRTILKGKLTKLINKLEYNKRFLLPVIQIKE